MKLHHHKACKTINIILYCSLPRQTSLIYFKNLIYKIIFLFLKVEFTQLYIFLKNKKKWDFYIYLFGFNVFSLHILSTGVYVLSVTYLHK